MLHGEFLQTECQQIHVHFEDDVNCRNTKFKWRYDCRSGNCIFLNFFFFWGGGVIYNCLNWNYHSDDHIFIFMSIVHFVSILGMKTFLLDGWHKPKLSSQNNVDVKLMHVWKVTEGQQSMSAKQWPVLLLFYSTPANINNYFSKRPWYSSPQECYFRVIVFASFHLRSVIFE